MDNAPREHENASENRRNRHLAMLSHDLKSALTGVIGGLKQIETEKLNNTDLKHRDGALASALEASRLLDGILDIEAIESGQFELNVEITNLEGFLAEIYRRWTARAEWKNLNLKVFMDGDLPKTVELDRGRLSRVLGNLLDNAIKYTDAGKVELSVHMEDTNQLAFTICDDGIGFSEEALDSLFEFRGRPANSTKPGSGLGLYISQSLLSQMGGEIKICNRPGRGAEAVVIVKTDIVERPSDEENQTASVSVFPSTKLPDLSGLTILLAEDNITNQMVVTQMLDAMGAQFEIASDGVEALEKFEVHDFDVLLLDIEMPRMSGLDVIRSVRSRTDKKQAKTIIALTAYAMREHREKISSAGADGLIAKPILGIEDFGVDILNYHQKSASDRAPLRSVDSGKPANDALIDNTIYKNLENTIGRDTMDELLSKVALDFGTVKEGVTTGLENKDKKAIGAASHVLISVAGAIGAVSTQEAAQALTKACHHGDWTDIATHSETCLTNIEELLRFAEEKIHR
jgi:CheY-like chemotaxis protein